MRKAFGSNPLDFTLASAWLVGLLGSTHCLGMCGGIVGMLSVAAQGNRARQWLLLGLYNLGRIGSYAAAGALLGASGNRLFEALPGGLGRWAAQLLAAVFMIALGLYLTGWWTGLARLERIGAHLWRRIEPAARRLLPVRHPLQAFGAGMLWGFLPCGLVYSMLAWTLSADDALTGASMMAAFGLGTAPMLLVSGGLAGALRVFTRRQQVRRASGLIVLAFGLYALLPGGLHHGHRHAVAELPPASTGAAT